MNKDFISVESEWDRLYGVWADQPDWRGTVLRELNVVSGLLPSDLGRVSVNLSSNDLYNSSEQMDYMRSFCNIIHEEHYAKIDELFKQQMQGFSEVVHMLNPNEFSVDGTSGDTVTIPALIDDTDLDSALKDNYKQLCDELSTDVPSDEAAEAFDEDLWQWHTQVSYEDIVAIDRTIYAADNTVGELYYEMSPYLVIKNSDYSETTLGGMGMANHYFPLENGIMYDLDEDQNNECGAYQTFFHEMGHMMDNIIPEVISDQDVNNTHWAMISNGSYGGYGQEFYDNLIGDVEYYRTHYNEINGTNYATQEEIDQAIASDLRTTYYTLDEISDLYSGITRFGICGGYWHRYALARDENDKPIMYTDEGDKISTWINNVANATIAGMIKLRTGRDVNVDVVDVNFPGISYWLYDENNNPNMTMLNMEAFAHFSEMSVMQGTDDMDGLQTYFPNAYATYEKMMEDMKEQLDASRI